MPSSPTRWGRPQGGEWQRGSSSSSTSSRSSTLHHIASLLLDADVTRLSRDTGGSQSTCQHDGTRLLCRGGWRAVRGKAVTWHTKGPLLPWAGRLEGQLSVSAALLGSCFLLCKLPQAAIRLSCPAILSKDSLGACPLTDRGSGYSKPAPLSWRCVDARRAAGYVALLPHAVYCWLRALATTSCLRVAASNATLMRWLQGSDELQHLSCEECTLGASQ